MHGAEEALFLEVRHCSSGCFLPSDKLTDQIVRVDSDIVKNERYRVSPPKHATGLFIYLWDAKPGVERTASLPI